MESIYLQVTTKLLKEIKSVNSLLTQQVFKGKEAAKFQVSTKTLIQVYFSYHIFLIHEFMNCVSKRVRGELNNESPDEFDKSCFKMSTSVRFFSAHALIFATEININVNVMKHMNTYIKLLEVCLFQYQYSRLSFPT